MVSEDKKHSMKQLEEDPLYCSKHDEKMTMSVEDEHATLQPCKKFNWPMEKLICNLSFLGLMTSGKLKTTSNKPKAHC